LAGHHGADRSVVCSQGRPGQADEAQGTGQLEQVAAALVVIMMVAHGLRLLRLRVKSGL
jgi:hypothetical protein